MHPHRRRDSDAGGGNVGAGLISPFFITEIPILVVFQIQSKNQISKKLAERAGLTSPGNPRLNSELESGDKVKTAVPAVGDLEKSAIGFFNQCFLLHKSSPITNMQDFNP